MVQELKTPTQPLALGGRQSRLIFTLRLVFGLGIVGLLIWRADFSNVIAALIGIDPFWLAMAFLVQIGAKFVWSWRWSVLLQIFRIPSRFSRLVKGIYVGLFFSNFLPTSFGGDLYRGYWILDDKKLYPKSMFIIFTERFIGFACLGYIALPAFLFLLTRGVGPWDIRLLLLVLLGGLCGSVLALHPAVFAFFNRLLFRPESRLLMRLRNKVSRALHTLHESGKRRWRVYLLSFGVHLAGIMFFYSLGRGLGLSLEAWHYFVIVPLMVVATLLPVSFNGLGVREGTLVLLTTALGVGVYPAQAIALGLMSSIVILAVSLIGGAFYIVGTRGKLIPPNLEDINFGEKMTAATQTHVEKSRHIKVAIHGEFYRWSKSWVTDKVVLDAGCGEGFGAATLAETACKVVGIDNDPEIVETASRLYPLKNIEFQLMDCQNMTFQPASFDIVICNALFEYLPDVKAFMRGAFHILKPGGLFICGTKNLQLSLKKADRSPLYSNHLREFTPVELKSELEKYYSEIRMFGEGMKTQSEAYIMNGRALKIERLLVTLGIKHRFPKSWRNHIRKRITGVDVDDISSNDFEIVANSLDDALYIIGCGTKP